VKAVWDLGANNGHYSQIATDLGAHTVAFDIDPVAVDSNWRRVKKTHDKTLPLILDLTAPSPAIGFGNNERLTIDERQKPDVIMMLAVIHHMAISNNLPFDKIANWLSGLCRYLIIEFVPKEDSQVQLLLKTRTDIFDDYNESHFEEVFCEYFVLLAKSEVEDSQRTLYLLETQRSSHFSLHSNSSTSQTGILQTGTFQNGCG
jgi:ribosomal protein L11 methylase PrmA